MGACLLTTAAALAAGGESQPRRGFTLIAEPYALETAVFDGARVREGVPVENRDAETDGGEPMDRPGADPAVEEGDEWLDAAAAEAEVLPDWPEGELVFVEVIRTGGTPWMRVHFGDSHLGAESYVVLTSLRDGEWHRLDARALATWSNTSAIFNGHEVELRLYVAPDDAGVYVTVDQLLVADPLDFTGGLPDDEDPADGGIASICGDGDERVSSNDSRVGRLFFGGCTGWLAHFGGALTAWHCGNPDGNLGGVVMEFNVPMSTSNGVPVAAAVNDQFPVTMVVAFESDGEGEDYNVYAVGQNNVGENAHLRQGFLHITSVTPSVGTTVRVTGYGLDPFPSGSGGAGAACCDWDSDNTCNNTCNQFSLTQQTDTGACDDCLQGTAIEHTVDTLPANSGSPLIWNSNGIAIGIHAQGGCDSFWSDYDNGATWLGYTPLRNAMHNFQGPNTTWVNKVVASTLFQTGNVVTPWDTVTKGIMGVTNGGQVAIVAGTYPASAGNTFTTTKAMTLIAPVGMVTIGN